MGFLKKILIACLLAVPLHADQIASSSFKGINNNESPVIIDPSYAQDLLNVDVTAGGKSVKKRPGFGVYKALSTSKPMHGGFHSFNSTGDDVQIWGSSTSLYGITADGTPAQLISSATLNSTWDCADTQGNSYCVNSNRDMYLLTNGVTKTWYSSPLGTMVEATPDRVVVAGVSGAPNTLYVSQSNTFTNFTTGVNETDAFAEVIAAPGSKLTHIRWGCGKLLWWKDQSMGYFDFDDQYTGQVKTVSDTIGTFDNTSAIDPGGRVWFRGQEGHTWMYDCSFLTKQSIDITPSISASGRRASNSWAQTTTADFNLGSSTNVSTASDQLSLSFFSDGFSSLGRWTQYSGSWSASSNAAVPVYSASPSTLISSSAVNIPNDNWREGVSASFQMLGNVSGGPYIGMVNASTQGYVSIGGSNPSTGQNGVAIWKVNGNTLTFLYSGSNFGTADTNYHLMELQQSGTTLTAYFDGVQVGQTTDSTYSGLNRPYLRCDGNAPNLTCNGFKSFVVGNSTGSFYSAVHNAPNLTAWSTLGINENLNGGTETYLMRSSTNSFTLNSSTPSWTAQTKNSLITISTGTYFQFADSFTVTASSQTPILNDFTVNWLEGSASDQAYMLYFDNAIWQSVAFSSTTLNYIFKYDLINDGWTLYNFGAGGLLVQNNALYFGDTHSGNIFNYATATSDNGTAINAFWKSKDFAGGDPFLQTQLTNIDTFSRRNQGSTLSVAYTMDTSTTTSYSMGLSNSTQSIIQSRKLLPSGKLGQVFNIQYGDTSTSSAWELLGYRLGFVQQPYRPN